MVVKELILEALTRANHIQRGRTASADELSNAVAKLNSELRIYSDRNLITAYQKVIDVESMPEQVIGKYNVKDGMRVHKVNKLPEIGEIEGVYVEGVDFFYNDGTFFEFKIIEIVEDEESEKLVKRTSINPLKCCSFVPDVICEDVNKIVACMCTSEEGWRQLRHVPLSLFYTDDDRYTYCATPCGENKVNLRLGIGESQRKIRIVYNTSMKLELNDSIELPEIHIELLTLALTCALLSEDVDDDGKALANYQAQLDDVEQQIMAQNSTTRRIQRDENHLHDRLRSGSFIFHRRR